MATRVDFWLDAALLVAFTLDYTFTFTGLAVHEWIGLGLALALVMHLTLHWQWAVRTTRRLLGRIGNRTRVQWLANLALVVSLTMCVASGVMISEVALPFLGLHVSGSQFMSTLHTTTASISLILVAIHVALDWRWILTVARRLTPPRSATLR